VSRDLETVYQGLVGAFNGLELVSGGVLTAEGHVTTTDATTRQQLPYLAFATGSIDASEWGSEDWTDEIRWTIPATLIVQAPVSDGGSLMRAALVDLMQHARRVRGLPYDKDGKLVCEGTTAFVKRFRDGEVELFTDRKGPHIANIRVDGPFDSGQYIAQLTFRVAFLMNLDPRELVRAQVAVLGVKTFDAARSEIDVSLPVQVQMPRFTDSDRRAVGRFEQPSTRVIDGGVPKYAPFDGNTGTVGQRLSEQVREVMVFPRTLSVAALATSQLSAIVIFQDDASQTLTAAASWASSDDTKATVSSAGLVTAVAAGSATITATYAGVTATCVVTVT
jgi:hypothetical protein